jgi:hypothetical protein
MEPKTTEPKKQIEPVEPTLSLSLEESSLIKDGLNALPPERKKTVVFDRLLMKLGKAEAYWHKIEKARQVHKEQLTVQLRKRTK